MDNRGIIRNRKHALQIRDFSGLRFGNITPTDIDGMIEYHNLCYVYIETKYKDAELPGGQRLALERQCDDMQNVKPAIAIVATHETSGDIDVANTVVSEIRFMGKWCRLQEQTTTRQLIDRFFGWVEMENMKGDRG